MADASTQPVEAALENMITALRMEGIKVRVYSQGEGTPFGLEYVMDAKGELAGCCWHDGLNFTDLGNTSQHEVHREMIRAHCILYYLTRN